MSTVTEIQVGRGEDITLNFTCWSNPPTNSIPENITGWTIVFTVSREPDQLVKYFEKPGALLLPASGTFRVNILEVDTDIVPGTYAWDVWRVDSGSKRLLGYGAFVILANVRLPD